MKQRTLASRVFRLSVLTSIATIAWTCTPARAQATFQISQGRTNQTEENVDAGPEAELRIGIALTGQGRFSDAIPHLLAAQGHTSNKYAAGFDLALCYVATDQNPRAIQILRTLSSEGHRTAEVYNLLAQALIGNSQPNEAFDAFERAVALEPKSEKLYLLVADSCMDHQLFELGLKVADVGLQNLPASSRLHYERGIFLYSIDQPDRARGDLKMASQLAPGSDISFLAAAQRALLDGNIPEAIRASRAGAQKSPDNYILLWVLGQSLIRYGVREGQPEFDEARTVLEKSVSHRPNFAASQLALGQLYLTAHRLEDATKHLEIARQLAPGNTSVYSHLAAAYQRRGDAAEAQKMLAILATLNQGQAAKYKSGPPEHKASYSGSKLP